MKHYSNGHAVSRFVTVLCVLLMTACASMPPPIQDEPLNWSIDFERSIKFQLLVNDDLLVVATTRHLYGMNPASGKVLWRKRNVEVTSNDLLSAGEKSYLLVNDASGGAFDDRDTNILALDQGSGEIVWESSLLEGKVLQGALDQSQDRLVFTKVQTAHGDDRGFLSGVFGRKGLGSGFKQQPYFGAIEVSSGRILWARNFDQEVRMRPGQQLVLDENSDWIHTRSFDLGLFHPPLIANGLVCLTYAGLYCYDAATGDLEWWNEFQVIEKELAKSYANPVIDDSHLIMAGDHRVRMYDLETGKLRWKSEKFDIIPEILVGPEVVYAQLGGEFFDIKKEKWKWKGEFGVAAVDKENGKTLWVFDSAKDAMTNVLVVGDDIWLADEKRIMALNRADGSVKLEIKHDFEGTPIYTALNEENQVLLIGEGEAAAFDTHSGDFVWHVRYPPLGPSAWRRFSTGLLHASGNILKFGSFVLSAGVGLLPSRTVPLGALDFKIINTKRIVSASMARSGRRMTYQSGLSSDWEGNQVLSGNYQYFVTKPKGSKDVMLAVVNLSSGQTERMVRLDSEAPNVVIDEGNNKIYETFGQQLVALPLQTWDSNHTALPTDHP